MVKRNILACPVELPKEKSMMHSLNSQTDMRNFAFLLFLLLPISAYFFKSGMQKIKIFEEIRKMEDSFATKYKNALSS